MEYVENIDEKQIEFYLPLNKQSYIKRFKRVSEGKWMFNFSAAIFGEEWFAYQFLLREVIIINMINTVVSIVITVQINCNYFESNQMMAAFAKASITIIFIKAILFGVIGDKLLWGSIKRRIKRDMNVKHNIYTDICSQIESSDKRVVVRGVIIVVCSGIMLLLRGMLVPAIVNLVLY